MYALINQKEVNNIKKNF